MRILSVVVCLWAVACSGDEFTGGTGQSGASGSGAGGGAGGSSGGGGNGGNSGGGGSGGAPISPCPSPAPAVNGACPSEGLKCSYGTDPRPSCRDRYQCAAGQWTIVSQAACTKDPGCASQIPIAGTPCLSRDQICVYPADNTVCGCPACASFCTTERWICTKAPGGGCPSGVPNEGESCASPGKTCRYGDCALRDVVDAHCQNSAWVWEAAACPAG